MNVKLASSYVSNYSAVFGGFSLGKYVSDSRGQPILGEEYKREWLCGGLLGGRTVSGRRVSEYNSAMFCKARDPMVDRHSSVPVKSFLNLQSEAREATGSNCLWRALPPLKAVGPEDWYVLLNVIVEPMRVAPGVTSCSLLSALLGQAAICRDGDGKYVLATLVTAVRWCLVQEWSEIARLEPYPKRTAELSDETIYALVLVKIGVINVVQTRASSSVSERTYVDKGSTAFTAAVGRTILSWQVNHIVGVIVVGKIYKFSSWSWIGSNASRKCLKEVRKHKYYTKLSVWWDDFVTVASSISGADRFSCGLMKVGCALHIKLFDRASGMALAYALLHDKADELMDECAELDIDPIKVSRSGAYVTLARQRDLVKEIKDRGFEVFVELGRKGSAFDPSATDVRSHLEVFQNIGVARVVIESERIASMEEKGVLDGFLEELSRQDCTPLVLELPYGISFPQLLPIATRVFGVLGPEANVANVDIRHVLALETVRTGTCFGDLFGLVPAE